MPTVGQKLARQSGAFNRMTMPLALPVTAGAANADFVAYIPAGSRNVKFNTKTSVAFGAVTDAQISIGNAAAGAQYVAAVSIKAAGEVNHTLVAGAMAELDTVPGKLGDLTPVYVRVAQTGGNSATGTGVLFVEYSTPL